MSSRRAKGSILFVCDFLRNTEEGPKDTSVAADLFISEALSSDEAGGTVVEKNVRKGKPSEKMGRKATDPAEKIVGKQSCRAGHSVIVISDDVEWKRHLC